MLDTLPRAGGLPQTILGGTADALVVLSLATQQPPDLAQVADAIARYRACQGLREFRARLYDCLASRPDALADDAAQVRETCARRGRLRFAIDATPCPRPDAECSPGRGHVHHYACRCDGTRKTIPGWEYQFTAAIGHLRTAWAALIDVERTTAATRTRQTTRQVKNLLRRLHAAGTSGRGAPLVAFDAAQDIAAQHSASRDGHGRSRQGQEGLPGPRA